MLRICALPAVVMITLAIVWPPFRLIWPIGAAVAFVIGYLIWRFYLKPWPENH